jgi:hypothetical protein
MATSGLKFAPIEQELGQADLRFFGDLLGKFAETGQLFERVQGVRFAANLLKMSASGQQTIDKIERPAHGAASLQT